MGLSAIIQRMMPHAEITTFETFEALTEKDNGQFYHYFTSPQSFLKHAAYFLERQHKTIILVHGDENGQLPRCFHTLNVCQSEQTLVRSFLKLAQQAHTAKGKIPEAVSRAQGSNERPVLTPREHEVLRGIVSGRINKEIAAQLGVSLATVISHRKNIAEKLGTKSVSALTIFAVAHGIVKVEDI